MKKSNNPFKMWGSYVGAVVYFIAYYTIGFETESWANNLKFIVDIPNMFSSIFVKVLGTNPIILFILPMTFGFLIGWLITYIWRKR